MKNMNIIKILLISFVTQLSISPIKAQDVSVDLVNQVLDSIIGKQNYTDIPVFETMEDVCFSHYFTCDAFDNIIGLDFQFANLTGTIPTQLFKLKDLEYVNFEFNYLKGTIPEGFSSLDKLEEILLSGNFLEGPLPTDFKSSLLVDLKQNSIQEKDKKTTRKYNIVNQINLESCRSPDSIFIKTNQDFTKLNSVTPKDKNNPEFKVVQKMPRFPGCEEKDVTDEERKSCADNLLLQYIYRNLTYPAKDRALDLEGTAVVRFVILKDGQIADAEVVRNPGLCMGNSTLWIVNRMNYLCDRWNPGLQSGKVVKVLYTLPVKFKLE